MKPPPDVPKIPFAAIGEPFEALLLATINKSEREWPPHWAGLADAQATVERMLRVARNTWRALRFLCAQEPEYHARKVEFALAAAPMVRSNLEVLFAFIFLFDDLGPRANWFMKSGWREVQDEYARHQSLYGTDPDWREWLDGYNGFVEQLATLAKITDADRARPASIKWWPTPGKMIKHPSLNPERKAFMEFLNDWHYKQLSSQHHLSMPGLVMRSQALMPASQQEEHFEWHMEKQRSDVIVTALILTLAILTEVNHEAHFALNTRLAYIWGTLTPDMGIARELYDRRYQGMVNEPSAA